MEKVKANEVAIKSDEKETSVSSMVVNGFSSVFKPEIVEKVDKGTLPLLKDFEKISTADALSAWKKAYLLSRIWARYKAVNGKKAKKEDLRSFYKGGRSSFYNLLDAGEYVKKTEDGKLAVPSDINGVAFEMSNFLVIKKEIDFINSGDLLATMSQSELKKKVDLLKGVIEDKSEDEEEIVEESESESESDGESETENKPAPLEVLVNGKRVDLTEDQIMKILEIIAG